MENDQNTVQYFPTKVDLACMYGCMYVFENERVVHTTCTSNVFCIVLPSVQISYVKRIQSFSLPLGLLKSCDLVITTELVKQLAQLLPPDACKPSKPFSFIGLLLLAHPHVGFWTALAPDGSSKPTIQDLAILKVE